MIWVGGAPQPVTFHMYAEMWRTLMPDWTIRIWGNADINEEEFPTDAVGLINAVSKGAQKADIMRYFILEKYGGIYVDGDVEPLRSLEPVLSLQKEIVLCHDLPITWPYISIGFIAAAPHHPLLKLASNKCYHADIQSSSIHFETGPRLFGNAIWETPSKEPYAVLPPDTFYYNDSNVIAKQGVILPEGYSIDHTNPHHLGVHHYAKSWWSTRS
jgi:mannosyltransferase OCH1-like enzyme